MPCQVHSSKRKEEEEEEEEEDLERVRAVQTSEAQTRHESAAGERIPLPPGRRPWAIKSCDGIDEL